ncbi:unnamed protein product, partial [marine sediment metagenome]
VIVFTIVLSILMLSRQVYHRFKGCGVSKIQEKEL